MHMKITPGDCAVFFDFDNTITLFDVFDNIIETFAVDKKWMEYESAWKRGEIGSKDCLSGQLKSVKIDKKGLEKYLAKIKVDPHFKKIVALLKKRGVAPVIVSDSFRFFLEYILKNNGIGPLKIYSNQIRFSKDRLVPAFPHQHSTCRRCGNCKKKHLPDEGRREKTVIYIGDGLSDLCPARHSDIVFAKGSLKRYLTKEGKEFFPFETLKDVYAHLSSRFEF
ncbi:MAG: MtnX-like HAD-IB family phosphatase [Candidatus Omnitrophica bacterium]|nr:MtnX-like HAD-IB family phosphatase [Candidatus Omnitrophota bacterium]